MTKRQATPAQHKALNAWAQFGAAQFVSKVGKHWQVKIDGYQIPAVFKTKKAALEYAERAVDAFVKKEF